MLFKPSLESCKLNNNSNPGKATDDQAMYGSGASSNSAHSGNTGILSGEGSHLSSARDNKPGATTGTGPVISNVGDTVILSPDPATAGHHTTDIETQ